MAIKDGSVRWDADLHCRLPNVCQILYHQARLGDDAETVVEAV